MNDFIDNFGGYVAGALVWCFDHWSGIAAFTLFLLQGIYQVYKIKKARRDLKEDTNVSPNVR